MKILKEYQSGLKEYSLDHTDYEYLINNFNFSLTASTVRRLCDYLRKTNKEVIVEECYDSQSGWKGENFWLDGVDLSGNGYCLCNGKVFKHISEMTAKQTKTT